MWECSPNFDKGVSRRDMKPIVRNEATAVPWSPCYERQGEKRRPPRCIAWPEQKKQRVENKGRKTKGLPSFQGEEKGEKKNKGEE